MRMRGAVATSTAITTANNNNMIMDERTQLMNEDNALKTRMPRVSFAPSQTMAMGEGISHSIVK